MKFRWITRQKSGSFGLPLHSDPLMNHCLVARGFTSVSQVKDFLSPKLKNLRDPFEVAGIGGAVARLVEARTANEKVVVFGDYDVDGVCATAILVETLAKLGWAAEPYLPHRVEEGYGLSEAGVERCIELHSPTLLVAVDCGTSSAEVVEGLKGKGIDAIILDHHQPGKTLAKPVALVNPQLEEKGLKELCAAGLAFKLAHALVKHLREVGDAEALKFDVREHLQFVALATIADIVPVTGENRILVSSGLERLNRSTNPGIIALKRVAQIQTEVSTYHVGYLLGPRLNAAGRLDEAMLALQLLLTKSEVEATKIAEQLNKTNMERQQTELEIFNSALELVEKNFNPETDYVIIEGNADWHIGVIGIVASRLQQRFYRPVILAGGGDLEWRGSGRSIQGFNIAEGLQNCSEILIKHGGHAMAAGITIESAKWPVFREKMNQLARTQITRDQLQPVLAYDAEIKLENLQFHSVQLLQGFEPFGPGNPAFNFLVRGARFKCPPSSFGKEGKHLRCVLTDGTGSIPAIWWNCPGMDEDPAKAWDLVVQTEINTYNGQSSVRLKILDCTESKLFPQNAGASPAVHQGS